MSQPVPKCCTLAMTQVQSRFFHWSIACRQWSVQSHPRHQSLLQLGHVTLTSCTRVPACSPKSCNWWF